MEKKELIAEAEEWFLQKDWNSFPFQRRTWNAFLDGKNGLLNAPTGSGKTYALWVPIVLNHMRNISRPGYKNRPGLKAIWITPLRALSVEIEQACRWITEQSGTALSVGVRTGDTPQKLRASQKKQMPDLLITTPESLHLLLSSRDCGKTFRNLNAVIVDEWHELLGTKRGVQVELALSRLKSISQELKIWGISATIGNLNQAKEVLLGPDSEAFHNSVLIKAKIKKEILVKSILPKKMESFPWRGHLGLHLLDEIVPILRKSKTTLLFTNTRSQCEIWFQRILEKYPEFAGELAMHHGSISRDTRRWVEQAIREEELRVVVATSSLDLGVDFAPVETIIQIGGPKGVARFLQRAGRSGHRPGATSLIYFLPTHAMELIEASALRKAVTDQVVEDRVPYLLSFDVLVQYLITLAVGEGFSAKAILPEIRSTFCYSAMSDEQWVWILNFIAYGSQSLEAYDEYKKVEIREGGWFKVNNRGTAMRHRLQIGTIVGDAVLTVKYLGGGYLGTIEESFISKLDRGDVFTFAGRTLELFKIKNMQVIVRRSKQKSARFPSWAGGRMTFSARMSDLLRKEIHLASKIEVAVAPQEAEEAALAASEELFALRDIFRRQELESVLPGEDEFLVETFKTREGYHAVFYPFEGRFVHEALSSLLAYRISLLSPVSFSLAFNDYGFELLSDQPLDMQQVLDNKLFSKEYLNQDLQRSLNATEMARRKFRDIAVISGLVFTGFPDRLIKTKHLQSSAQLLFSVFRDYEPENLLFQQAFRETFDHQLQEGRLLKALERISQQKTIWKDCKKPTPFAFPIITDRMREKLSSEKLADRIRKMIKKWQDL